MDSSAPNDAAADAPPPLKPPAPPTLATSLEAVELELSLGQRDMNDDAFETVVRETVESFGAVLLFNMKLQSSVYSVGQVCT